MVILVWAAAAFGSYPAWRAKAPRHGVFGPESKFGKRAANRTRDCPSARARFDYLLVNKNVGNDPNFDVSPANTKICTLHGGLQHLICIISSQFDNVHISLVY
jgi:hypothetical protein